MVLCSGEVVTAPHEGERAVTVGPGSTGNGAGNEKGKRMRRRRSFGGLWWAVAILLTFGLSRAATAIYLDEDQNVSLRARVYSQGSVRTNESQVGTIPHTESGWLIQHRNYYNPEFEAKLTKYAAFLKQTNLGWLTPDDFSFRMAAWGFYDGIYDYGPRGFDDSQRHINSTCCGPPPDPNTPKTAWILEGSKYNRFGKSVATIFPGAHVQNPRDIYANYNRLNEMYLNYSKGPVFVRFGKQFISWGESDTVALLDENNPFDITAGPPGAFEDLEESRIPLWTLRSSVTVFDTLGPLSSGFIEGYWVPGDLDTNTGILPIRTASPYSPRGPDPQAQIPNVFGHPAINAQFVLLDHIPQKRFENSQWGVRVQTVVNRTHTASAWYYTTFASAPVPQSLGLIKGVNVPGGQLTTTETVHRMTGVLGVADTFFLEPLDGIIRMEAEYFIGEPAFIPSENLNITNDRNDLLKPITNSGRVPRADYLRWELGYDRFFFMRFLNPSNSFTWVTAVVGSWNADEKYNKDFRYDGQFKPEFLGLPLGTGPKPGDFVQLKTVEVFAQTHLQTDYMHGRLSPAITYIQNLRGTYALLPSVTYRLTDWMLFTLNYTTIGGEYQQLGFFRDRDQVSMRATYQLN